VVLVERKAVLAVLVVDQEHQQLLDQHYKVVLVVKVLDLSPTGLVVAVAAAVGTAAVVVAVVMTLDLEPALHLVVAVDLDT
jgi:predicted nicotinamide N-methyase